MQQTTLCFIWQSYSTLLLMGIVSIDPYHKCVLYINKVIKIKAPTRTLLSIWALPSFPRKGGGECQWAKLEFLVSWKKGQSRKVNCKNSCSNNFVTQINKSFKIQRHNPWSILLGFAPSCLLGTFKFDLFWQKKGGW